MKRKSIVLGALASVIAVSMLVVATQAFFTDRAEGSGTINAGTLKITANLNVNDATAEDTTNGTKSVDTKLGVVTATAIAPGDAIPMVVHTKNTGSIDALVRQKIVLTVTADADHTLTALTSDAAEFEVYKASDVEKDTSNGYWKPKSGANPVAITDTTTSRTVSGLVVTYQLAPQSLATGSADVYDKYVILFRHTAGNAFQGCGVKVDAIVEALQDKNTDNYKTTNDWSELQVDGAVTLSSSVTAPGVPQASESTGRGFKNPN